MVFDHLVVVRGGGDLGTGVAWRLRRVGFPVVVLEIARPLTIRRTVAFSTAVTEGSIEIDGITGKHASSVIDAEAIAGHGEVPVLVSSDIPAFLSTPSAVVDARLAKRNIDTRRDQAPLVVGLGPGFVAGEDCDAVVETMRGHDLGRVIWQGSALPNTGVPGVLGGASADRIVRAPTAGVVTWFTEIGAMVDEDEALGEIAGSTVRATIAGVVRGLIAPGPVEQGLKIADIDPRGDANATTSISDKSLSVAGGVLEALLTWMSAQP